MAIIKIYNSKVKFDKSTKTFVVDGRLVLFASRHTVYNEKTNKQMVFEFSHSTGSEWDIESLWIYKSPDGFILHVGNQDVTPRHKQNYLNAKMR